ncbi:diphthamide synthesis protein [Nanoarchaeota archaeon]
MKTLFIPAKSTADLIPVVEKALDKLKGKVGLVTTVQHLHKLKEVKEFLDSKDIDSELCGQVLGCNAKAAKGCDTYLYVGSGQFHPIAVKLETGKDVVVANPLSCEVSEVSNEEVEKYKGRVKGAYTKFLSSDEIGILVSVKSGQKNLESAYELEKRFPEKNFYILLTNTLNFKSLEDFNFIQCFVNTMCPRLIDDYDKFPKPVVNIEDIK